MRALVLTNGKHFKHTAMVAEAELFTGHLLIFLLNYFFHNFCLVLSIFNLTSSVKRPESYSNMTFLTEIFTKYVFFGCMYKVHFQSSVIVFSITTKIKLILFYL